MSDSSLSHSTTGDCNASRQAKVSLSSGRVICPKCGRKGLGYAGHPHATGYKDYNRATCRYCRTYFKVKDPML